jgi:hypothetical protein
VAIYRRHYEAAARLVGAIEVDASRIDSMVAVRMRVTGHSRAAIARAIEAGAPARGARHHNWSDYARRTVGYAFSLTGDRKAAELAGYRSHWLAIEGNGPAHSFSKKQPKPRQASAIKAPKLPENLVVAPTSATPSKPRETEASPKPMQKRPAASKGIE